MFRAAWERYDIRGFASRERRFRHPSTGELTLEHHQLTPTDHPDLRVVVYTALGRIWLTTAEGQKDPVALGKAIEALQPAAAQADAVSETRALYGRALALSGNMVAAERMLLRAVAMVPVDPSAYRYLAEVAGQLGHATIAKDAAAKYALLASSAL